MPDKAAWYQWLVSVRHPKQVKRVALGRAVAQRQIVDAFCAFVWTRPQNVQWRAVVAAFMVDIYDAQAIYSPVSGLPGDRGVSQIWTQNSVLSPGFHF